MNHTHTGSRSFSCCFPVFLSLCRHTPHEVCLASCGGAGRPQCPLTAPLQTLSWAWEALELARPLSQHVAQDALHWLSLIPAAPLHVTGSLVLSCPKAW